MKLLFAGGGTGGHLFAGIAVAEEYLDFVPPGRGTLQRAPTKKDILFVGTSYGLENTMIPQLGYRLELIPVKQLKGKGMLHRLKTLAQIPFAFWKSFQLLKREKPDLVLGIGGYASGPVTLMARFMGIKTAILEQNAYPGFTNRVLGRFVHRVFIAFEGARKFFPAKKVVLTGNPVRKSFDSAQDRPRPSPSRERGGNVGFTILVLGGSQGAHSINVAMVDAVKFLSFSLRPKGGEKGPGTFERLRIIHQTGKADLDSVRQAYDSSAVEAQVMDFIQDIQNYYAQADLVIARAGAGTITELEITGKPAIFIPYPYAADDHQRLNAEEVARGGGARMILDRELSGKRLFEEIERFRKNPALLKRMGENIHALAKPLAAHEILKACGGMVDRSH